MLRLQRHGCENAARIECMLLSHTRMIRSPAQAGVRLSCADTGLGVFGRTAYAGVLPCVADW